MVVMRMMRMSFHDDSILELAVASIVASEQNSNHFHFHFHCRRRCSCSLLHMAVVTMSSTLSLVVVLLLCCCCPDHSPRSSRRSFYPYSCCHVDRNGRSITFVSCVVVDCCYWD